MTPLGPAEADELELHISQQGAAPMLMVSYSSRQTLKGLWP